MLMKTEALKWVATLSDKQFAEFFYEATHGRDTSDIPDEGGHFVLADVARIESGWEINYIAVPQDYDEWIDDAPICQEGECAQCGSVVRSWAKDLVCPVCGTNGYGS